MPTGNAQALRLATERVRELEAALRRIAENSDDYWAREQAREALKAAQ